MPTKFFKVPPPIQLVDPSTGKPELPNGRPIEAWSLERFVKSAILLDPRWTSTAQGLCSANMVLEHFRALPPHIYVGGVRTALVLELPDDVADLLAEVSKAPRFLVMVPGVGPQAFHGYGDVMPAYLPQLYPFVRALTEPTSERQKL